MELGNKYLVFKRADIEAALSKDDVTILQFLIYKIGEYRFDLGKPDNKYVVINQDEPYFPEVLKLMEQAEEKP